MTTTPADRETTRDLTLFEPPAPVLEQAPGAPADSFADVLDDSSAEQHSERTRGARKLAGELHPRLRLRHNSPEALSSSELLALLFGGEPTHALKLAGDLLSEYGGLWALRRASLDDLLGGGVLSETQAARVAAAVELCRRLAGAAGPEPPAVLSPEDVKALLGARMRDLEQEHFVVLLLDPKNQVLGSPTVSIGTASSAIVHPREVFKPAIRASATNVLVVHNHPTHQVQPSAEDRRVTEKLVAAGRHIDIEVLDHVILGGESYYSFKAQGLI